MVAEKVPTKVTRARKNVLKSDPVKSENGVCSPHTPVRRLPATQIHALSRLMCPAKGFLPSASNQNVPGASQLIDKCVGKRSSVFSKERKEDGPHPLSLRYLFIAVTFSFSFFFFLDGWEGQRERG